MTTETTGVWNDDLPWAAIRNTIKESENLTLDRIHEYKIRAEFDGGIWTVKISDE